MILKACHACHLAIDNVILQALTLLLLLLLLHVPLSFYL